MGDNRCFIPILIVYFFMNKQFISGLTTGAVKGEALNGNGQVSLELHMDHQPGIRGIRRDLRTRRCFVKQEKT
jgi:hypothetical protein